MERIDQAKVGEEVSKRQQKKQAKREKWQERKEEMRSQRREKRKVRKDRIRQQKANGEYISNKPEKKVIPRDPEQTGIEILFDCTFNELMTEKEITSLVKQLSWSYGVNRRSVKQVRLKISPFVGKLKDEFERAFPTFVNWRNVEISPLDLLSQSTITPDTHCGDGGVDGRREIVYLTADSENVIEKFESEKCYVIGGIVDKNRHKMICHQKATQLGLQTARLPISQYIQMDGRKVLTINHVFGIISAFLESGDWESAFKSVIPERKITGTSSKKRRKSHLVNVIKEEEQEGVEEEEQEEQSDHDDDDDDISSTDDEDDKSFPSST